MAKFRIWDKEYKRWANPSLFALDANGELTWTTRFNPPPKKKEDLDIQQSTGLKDKNGKEIFEGDKVRYKYRYNYDIHGENEATVFLVGGSFSPLPLDRINHDDDFYSEYVTDYEIIGHIFEEPKKS